MENDLINPITRVNKEIKNEPTTNDNNIYSNVGNIVKSHNEMRENNLNVSHKNFDNGGSRTIISETNLDTNEQTVIVVEDKILTTNRETQDIHIYKSPANLTKEEECEIIENSKQEPVQIIIGEIINRNQSTVSDHETGKY